MRILMLTQSYPPVPGGIEQHVRALSAALVARGHRVTVVTLWNTDLPDYEEDHGVRIYRIRGTMHRLSKLIYSNPERVYAPPFPDPELIAALRKILREERPQIVHAHNWMDFSFLPIKRWSGAALVVTLHSYNQVCARWNLLYHGERCTGPQFSKCADCCRREYGTVKGTITLLGSWAMNASERHNVDKYIAVSKTVAERNELVSRQLPHEVIYNFIRDEQEPLVPLPAELPAEEFLLYVGALARSKGVDVLLDAYRKLENAPPLVIIGYDVADDAAILEPPPPNVWIYRNWSHAAVMQAWERCLLGIVPSVWDEPCPTVVMEAMLSGRALVATRVGGIPELVVEGETGLLVAPKDSDGLAQALQQLMDSPALREQMGAAGKQRVHLFQASAIVPMIERVYQQVAATEMVTM